MNKPQIVIGLLGGVASGKSTVARLFAEEGGARVIDADQLAHQVISQPEICKLINHELGPGLLHEDGKLDRQALADLVFNDTQARHRLETITHPLILTEVKRLLAHFAITPGPIVIDAPLLLESGLDQHCNTLIFIRTDDSTRSKRAKTRGWKEKEIQKREKNQIRIEKKETVADFTIDNISELETTRARVRGLLRRLEKKRS